VIQDASYVGWLTSPKNFAYPYPFTNDPSAPTWWDVSRNFGSLRRKWLKDVLSVGPTLCDHYHYEGGVRKYHLYGAVCEKYTELGGQVGPLGVPLGNAYQQDSNWTAVEKFRFGEIFYSNTTGAHEMHGGIYARYNTLLQMGRNLGAALTDELGTPDGVGRFNNFEGGAIYWRPATGGIGIWGPIWDRWGYLGWERSPLGYPTQEPTASSAQGGYYARFDGGLIYWSPSTPASEVRGAILDEYGRQGWEWGWLGYPLTGELDTGYWCAGGRYNRFQYGFIDWCPNKVACAHHGDGRCADGRTSPAQ
jgi:uncharacterized protein with LGFP repeats